MITYMYYQILPKIFAIHMQQLCIYIICLIEFLKSLMLQFLIIIVEDY